MPFPVQCFRKSRTSKYFIYFQYNTEIIENIKSLDVKSRKWDASKKSWILDVKGLFELIKSYRNSDKIIFEFPEENGRETFIKAIKKVEKDEAERLKTIEQLEKNKIRWNKFKDELEVKFEKYREQTQKNLKDGIELYPHQIAAAMFINEVKNTLLALDMGTGKSISSIAYVEMNNFNKVFVITPNSLKFNYFGEVEKFTNSKAYIITPKASSYKNKYTIDESKYIIVNYEFFNPSSKTKFDAKFKALNIKKIDALIADECQNLKNNSSNTYKNFKRTFEDSIFKNNKPSKVFLSGTPAPNRAFELYSVLNQISPIDFATKTHFYEYYCGMKYDPFGFGWTTENENQKLEELFHKISPYTYRKRKEDVLKDLPDKIYQNVKLDFSKKQLKIYSDIERDVLSELSGIKTNPLTILLKLRQFTSMSKIEDVKEMIDSVLETGEKIVVVDMFKETLNELHKIYPNISGLHTGDQSVEDRGELVKNFQDPNSEIKIFFASIQTANYGLTLTAASKMIIITLPFSVGQYDQVGDRLHRIGAKFTVNIYSFIYKDSLDEYVFDVIESKRKEIRKALDNEDYETDISESVISDVIEKLKNKY